MILYHHSSYLFWPLFQLFVHPFRISSAVDRRPVIVGLGLERKRPRTVTRDTSLWINNTLYNCSTGDSQASLRLSCSSPIRMQLRETIARRTESGESRHPRKDNVDPGSHSKD
jgi:hypothetical protein